MIIDSHHHLWTFTAQDYGWIGDSMQILKKDFLPKDLEPLLQRTGIGGTLVVQARQMLEETEWLLKLAGEHSFILGVVGWVDLRSTGLAKQLEKYAPHPKMVGVRHVIHDEPDDDFMLREDFKRGIAQLGRFNLTYDLLIFPKHLSRAARLVKDNPEVRFILDHLAKPPIKSGAIQAWKEELEKLAVLPNVWCKLSGMVTEADLKSWTQEDFIPYMSVILDAFGPDKVMLGSDWPVCTLGGTYQEVMNIPLSYINSLSDTEQKKIKYLNAMDGYQLQTEY